MRGSVWHSFVCLLLAGTRLIVYWRLLWTHATIGASTTVAPCGQISFFGPCSRSSSKDHIPNYSGLEPTLLVYYKICFVLDNNNSIVSFSATSNCCRLWDWSSRYSGPAHPLEASFWVLRSAEGMEILE